MTERSPADPARIKPDYVGFRKTSPAIALGPPGRAVDWVEAIAKTQQARHESTGLQAAAINIVVAGFPLPLQPGLPSFLERALDWVSQGKIGEYMSQHRQENQINELRNTFNSVIDWVSGVFKDVEKEMQGLEWGRLYEKYHSTSYDPDHIAAEVKRLYADPYVKNRRGVFEYLLGGLQDTKLLDVRVFDDAIKRSVYAAQTKTAEASGQSNCPLCAMGHDANKIKVWKIAEMDADHVTAWSKGGGSTADNCQMLCITHNRAKGNR